MRLGLEEPHYPLDPEGKWFDAHYANVAVEFYRKLLGKPERNPRQPEERSPEDIDYIRRRAAEARANIRIFADRNEHAFAEPPGAVLESVKQSLGIHATPSDRRAHETGELA